MMRLSARTVIAIRDLMEYADTDDAEAYSEFFSDIVEEYGLTDDSLDYYNFDLNAENLARTTESLDINPYLQESRDEVLNALETYYL